MVVAAFLPMEFEGNVSGTDGSSGRVLLSKTFDELPGPAEHYIRFNVGSSAESLATDEMAAD